jgi:hypothetical protein
MNRNTFDALVAQYKEHGWDLRRILLTADSALNALGTEAYPDVLFETTDISAAWFSRRSQPDKVTWELRTLDPAPFALNAFLDDDLESAAKESILRETERRMRASRPRPMDN